MKVKLLLVGIAVTVLVLGGVGFAAYRYFLGGTKVATAPAEEESTVILPPVEDSVKVTVKKHPAAADTVVLSVSGLDGKYQAVEYDFEYDSEGRILGVNSGTKPIDIAGEATFSRDIYLGTCSRNVCKPDKGVTLVTVVMKFTGADGKKSQFSGDFPLE